MSPPGLQRYRAERLLRKEFTELRAKVLAVVRSQLHSKGVTLDPVDLEACYAQAWQGLYATVLGGEEVENPSAWLVLVTFRRAIDESRAAARAQVGSHARPAPLGPAIAGERQHAVSDRDLARDRQRAVSDPDFAASLDDRARLREVFEGLRSRLSARECEAASLCYLQGLSRSQAAAQLGISEARMRKLMEGAGAGRPGVAGKVGELLNTIKDGGWCEQQSSLTRAYAFGILDPDGPRHALAVAHCHECPACRAHVASLRGLAAVLPPLPVLSRLVLASATGTTAGACAGSGAGAVTSASVGASITGVASDAGGLLGAGSLGVKLAVTGLVVLGAGYAVLGSPAHGSARARRIRLPRPSVAGEAIPPVHPAVRGASKPATTRHATHMPPRPSTPHARSSHNRSSTGEAVAREFGPERVVSSGASPTPPAVTHPVPPTAGASNEFGFE